MIVRKNGCARAGLVGNPSDGYNGKTIAFTFRNFQAEVTLWESPDLELRPAPQDRAVFDSVEHLTESVQRTGYYGGVRLMKAAVTKFAEYCERKGIELPRRNFTMRYSTNIPRQVGLGGSSAIITAAMQALLGFYGVDIMDHWLPNVVLSAETEELGLTAGLQDRVAQAYQGVVYMDFGKEYMKQHGYGLYERLSAEALPPLYIAYRTDLSEESDQAHIRVRERYDMGEEKVIETMDKIASLADEAREALQAGRTEDLPEMIDRNFDLRSEIYPISEANMEMVRRARETGASCKFCGSGGAVVGTFDGQKNVEELRRTMEEGGYRFVLPEIVGPGE
ncbi:MAG: mevalonate kinase [Candidatus Brocadiia bacterium]